MSLLADDTATCLPVMLAINSRFSVQHHEVYLFRSGKFVCTVKIRYVDKVDQHNNKKWHMYPLGCCYMYTVYLFIYLFIYKVCLPSRHLKFIVKRQDAYKAGLQCEDKTTL